MTMQHERDEGDASRVENQHLRQFIDATTDYAIFLIDLNGVVRSWNPGVQKVLGYGRQDFIGLPVSRIFTNEDVASGAAARELDTAAGCGRASDERWHVRSDGTVFWAFGVMSAIRGHQGDLQGYGKIMRDATAGKAVDEERKQAIVREQHARREAEAAIRVRDQFLAMVSHELRTPLNAILGWARLLEEQEFDAAQARRALETISRNALLQSRLISDLLDVSRILAGTLSMERRAIDIAAVVQEAVDSVAPAAHAKAISIGCHVAHLERSVTGDPQRVQQILWNVLTNAVKFSRPGGRITIEIDQHDATAVLRVRDEGEGIAREFLPRVFDPFSQADLSSQREHGGLGLGLAIARQLALQHGGTIHADSAGPGHGATFVIALPLSQESVLVPRQPAQGTQGKPPLEGCRIVAVEDDPDSREVMAATLERAGATVIAVGTVEAALEVISSHVPDAVVCDIGLPREDGFVFIKRLRALPPAAGGAVPAAALTAYARPEDRLRALEAGYQLHLPKPIEPIEFVSAMGALLARPPLDSAD